MGTWTLQNSKHFYQLSIQLQRESHISHSYLWEWKLLRDVFGIQESYRSATIRTRPSGSESNASHSPFRYPSLYWQEDWLHRRARQKYRGYLHSQDRSSEYFGRTRWPPELRGYCNSTTSTTSHNYRKLIHTLPEYP